MNQQAAFALIVHLDVSPVTQHLVAKHVTLVTILILEQILVQNVQMLTLSAELAPLPIA